MQIYLLYLVIVTISLTFSQRLFKPVQDVYVTVIMGIVRFYRTAIVEIQKLFTF